MFRIWCWPWQPYAENKLHCMYWAELWIGCIYSSTCCCALDKMWERASYFNWSPKLHYDDKACSSLWYMLYDHLRVRGPPFPISLSLSYDEQILQTSFRSPHLRGNTRNSIAMEGLGRWNFSFIVEHYCNHRELASLPLNFIGILTYEQLNILEWFLPRINRHAIAIAHSIIRIVITVVVFGIIFLTHLWGLKMAVSAKIYVLSILICATGIFTMPFMVFRLFFYLAHKEEGLNAALLGCRISEAGFDIVFICLPYILRPVFRWATGGISPFPIETPQTNLGCYGNGREFGSPKGCHESTEGIVGGERSEEEHDVLGSQSSESLRWIGRYIFYIAQMFYVGLGSVQ